MLSETQDNGRAPLQSTKSDRASDPGYPQSTMRVRKRNGGSEPVNVNKIVRAVNRCCVGLPGVDAPSYKPLIVFIATRSASTSGKPAQQRFTARTILFTFTGSLPPLRFFTRMVVCGYSESTSAD